jgi:hypothetical protein
MGRHAPLSPRPAAAALYRGSDYQMGVIEMKSAKTEIRSTQVVPGEIGRPPHPPHEPHEQPAQPREPVPGEGPGPHPLIQG